MKRFLLFVLTAGMFAACTEDVIVEFSGAKPYDDAPETLTIGFEDDETRIQLNEDVKTVWNSGDEVSVFYRSNGNQKWQYKGEDGVRQATLSCVQKVTGNTSITKTIVVYPYDETYWLNTDSYCIEATVPATQHYAVDSYGVGDNLMVSQGEFTQFSLKNVYGWLKLQLTGDGETIKSIKFRGNDGEQVAGLIYVDTATAEATLASEMGGTDDNNAGGNLVFDDTILTEVTLDCGAGVTLGEEATAFYISLPPQTFANGFTVEIECDGYKPMILSTSNTLTIERNTIQPMTSVAHNANPIIPYNEIHYIATSKVSAKWYVGTGEYYFGVNVVSHEWDSSTNKGIITFNGNVTTVAGFMDCYNLTSIYLPDCVTSIGSEAFMDSGLKEIVIPESVTSIGSNAFYECNLTSIIIPKNVVSIGYHAFYHCYSLVDLYSYAILPPILSENAFVSCPKNVHVYEESLNLYQSSWSSIFNYVSLGNIPADTPTTSIYYTTSDGATTTSRRFVVKSNLYSGDSGDMVVYGDLLFIPESAFSYNNTLTSITIPQSVTKIGCYAFKNCSNLAKVYCKSVTPPTLLSDDDGDRCTFDNNHADRKIYVPIGSGDAYKSASSWSAYKDCIFEDASL